MTPSQETDPQALIFDIERFSTKDGPGIRTVVFFKGCNMRCYWCHNPEGMRPGVELQFDEEKCIGCMECVRVCPVLAHRIENGHHVIDAEKCTRCFACAAVCYSGALQLVGKNMTVEQVLSEILEDRQFYLRSGGGVTLSGGEVMLHVDFVQQLLQQCRQQQIHTAIESNLSLPWQQYERVLPLVDLVMADIKHMDDERHRQGTGISNRRVLENIQKMAALQQPIIIRTPVIPGFNDEPESLCRIAHFLQSISSLLYYELLSYNPLGNSKACIVGCKETPPQLEIPGREHMQELAAVVAESGIRLYVDGREYMGNQEVTE